jgi:hypothetical protein
VCGTESIRYCFAPSFVYKETDQTSARIQYLWPSPRALHRQLVKLLTRFKGSFLKWRYETIAVVLTALGELRDLCQNVLADRQSDFFGDDFQDQELLKAVTLALRWRDLWSFITCFNFLVIGPLEKFRR